MDKTSSRRDMMVGAAAMAVVLTAAPVGAEDHTPARSNCFPDNCCFGVGGLPWQPANPI